MRRTNMLVLMMGRAPEHAITSFLHFLPKHVVLITTPTFASTYRRRLPHWAKRYDFEGWVETIPEPFTHDAPAEITEALAEILTTQRFMEALGSAEPGDAKGIEMGLTGGTTLMSALVASLAGIIPIVRTHYVVRPEEDRAVSPLRDVIRLPSTHTSEVLKDAPPQITAYILRQVTDDKDDAEAQNRWLFEAAKMWPKEVGALIQAGLVHFDPEEGFALSSLAFFACVAARELSLDLHNLLGSLEPEDEALDLMFG